MKTSNYIIIAFFTFLFGGVFILFVDAKFNQFYNNGGLLLSKEKKLESFSVIVAEPGAYFQLRTAENPRILTIYQLPDSCKFPPFGIRNDTLFVFADPTTDKHQNLDMIYCKDLKSIVAKEKTYLNLQDFKIAGNDTLMVKLTNAKIDLFYQDKQSPNGAIFLQAKESEINMGVANIKTMDVKIDKSTIKAWNSSIGILSGTLKNYSDMQATATKRVNVEVDSTSLFNIHK